MLLFKASTSKFASKISSIRTTPSNLFTKSRVYSIYGAKLCTYIHVKTSIYLLEFSVKLLFPETIGWLGGKVMINRKPIATNSLFHWDGHYPTFLKRDLPTRQFMWVRRNCSSEEAFKTESVQLFKWFQKRGYELCSQAVF